MVFDTSLMTAVSGIAKERCLNELDLRGRLIESAVGARLLARSAEEGFDVFWWREGSKEVDFVISKGASALSAIEVESGHKKEQSGMAFSFFASKCQAPRCWRYFRRSL